MAKRMGNDRAAQILSQDKQRLDEVARLHAQWTTALKALETNPLDASANLAAARFLCFVKQDWENGLPLMLRTEGKLRAAAELEIAKPTLAAEQTKLADLWWQIAEKAPAVERTAMLKRSQHWYQQALDSLPNGLEKVRANQRIRDVLSWNP